MKSTAQAFLVLCACGGSSIVEGFSVAATKNMASAPKTKAKPSSDAVPGALVEHAVAWASANGLGMVVNDDEGLFTSTHLPFSLLPSCKMLRPFASAYLNACTPRCSTLSLTVQIACPHYGPSRSLYYGMHGRLSRYYCG